MKYFAYGSNILGEEMKELGAHCDGNGHFTYKDHAFLKDYELGFDIRSNGGKATVRPKKGEITQGVLYLINADFLKCLDAKEGYPVTYRRRELLVERKNGVDVVAWVYISNKGFGGKADQKYLRSKIIKGADQRGLNTKVYRKFLEKT